MSKPKIDYAFNRGSLDYRVASFDRGGGIVEEREGERPIIATPDKPTLEKLKKEL